MMNTPRVRTSHKLGEVAPNTWSDFEWAREHREDLFAQYGRCIVLVYNHEVIGKGQTLTEAVEDAEKHLPPDSPQVTPITEFIGDRHRLFRVRSVLQNHHDESDNA